MKLVATKRPPSEKQDRLEFVRLDGSTCEADMPRQGVLPHDLIHYVVESGLGLANGFLSLVARGADARFVMERTHDLNLRSVEQQAIWAEALVEALQTQLWSAAFDYEAFVYGVNTATNARGIEPPHPPPAEKARALFNAAVELNLQWQQVQPYKTLQLHFSSGAA